MTIVMMNRPVHNYFKNRIRLVCSRNVRTLTSIHLYGYPYKEYRYDAIQANRRYSASSISYSSGNNHKHISKDSPGLFQIPGLHYPSDFVTIAQLAVTKCRRMRSDLVASSENLSALRILYALDQISNEVCSVIDAAEFCRCVHSNKEWRDSASQAFVIIGDYISELNTDVGLYNCLELVSKAVECSEFSFTEEQKRMVKLLKAEFERDGIHLPESERSQLAELHQQISGLESMFTHNITAHKRRYFEVPEEHINGIIPESFFKRKITNNNSKSNNVHIPTDDAVVNTVLRHCGNASTRKEAFMQANTSCFENLEVIEALVSSRHELSRVLGFNSYAERYLQDKMAQNQVNVKQFLEQTLNSLKSCIDADMTKLLKVKQAVEGNSDLHPWDVPYYVSALKSHEHQFHSSELAPYFSLENCIEGMKVLCKKLFGIDMVEVEMDPGENWCNKNEEIHKLSLVHEREGPMGTIYLDLHPRDGKYAHAAHFAVRCGCAVNGADHSEKGNELEYQLPIVALVCNISSSINESKCLSHSEMETLFHEFGHAIHSLLSRTTFQHLSGTRAPVDFVETPSQLMELFVRDKRVLDTFAKHYVTGEPIPIETHAKLEASRKSFQSLDLQNQILYARFDQQLFGTPNNMTSTELFSLLHKQMNIPYADGTFWHAKFGHIVTYGAGYYSYLYDQVFAADIWDTCFSQDPLNRVQGHHLRRKMLIHGGAKDPNNMFKDLLGRRPSVVPFSVMSGTTT